MAPVDPVSYTLPAYLQAGVISSRVRRRRLAQFRTGSHWLGVEAGRWVVPRLPREERLCQRCSMAAVDDERHMLWECPALVDTRIQHIDLFRDGTARVEEFMQQDAAQLASFLQSCYRVCGAVEGWSAANS